MTKETIEGVYSKKPMGLNPKRRCRDIPFLLLFIAFWVGMYIIAAVAVSTGDIRVLTTPYDSNGNFCGYGNLTNATYLYYFQPWSPSTSKSICVNSCPVNTTYYPTVSTAICDYTVSPQSQTDLLTYETSGNCTAYIFGSQSILNRCIPLSLSYQSNVTNSTSSYDSLVAKGSSVASRALADVFNTWRYILGAIGISLIICFVYLGLLRWLAGPIVWTTIIVTNGVFIGLAIWLYYFWTANQTAYNSLASSQQTQTALWEVQGIEAAFILSAITAGVLLLICIFLRKRFNIAIQVIREASRAVITMPLIIVYPILMWLFLAGLFAYFLIILLFIVSPKSTINSVSAFGLTWTNNNMANYMVFYHIFGCLWGWGVITGFNQVSIAGAIASYYWTLNKRNMPRFPLFQAVVRTLLYHMGSICIGAMLLAIVQFLRVLLRVFQWHAKGLKKIPGSKWIFCCIDCCLKCLTSIVKWMNKNAYIIMALEGTAFCKSASTAFGLLTRNAFKLLAIDFISTFVLFLGKVSVSAAVFFGTWAIMRSQSSVLNLNFTFVPAIVVALGSYVVATVFFGVYSMAIDTIFMSYLEDTERNDGSEDRPYYMSEALQKLTNIKNSKVVPEMKKITPATQEF